jgi:hypothetical protein
MSTITRIDLTIPSSEATFRAKTLPGNTTPHRSFSNLAQYFAAIAGAVYAGKVHEVTGAIQAQATITVSAGGSSNNETMLLGNVTLTAKTSGAVAANGEFNISATAATQAASMVTAINTVSTLSGVVTATNTLGVITVTAVAPGTIGNGLQLSESLTNVAITHAFGTSVAGVDGHTFNYHIGQA